MAETSIPKSNAEPVKLATPEAAVTPSPAEAFRESKSRGTRVIIPSTSLYGEALSEGAIEEIKRQKASGDFRIIGGRPWWASTYTAEELKKAGLI